MNRPLAALLAIALATAPVAPKLARAEPDAAAIALKKKGDAAMDSLDYAGAIAAYDEAYARAHDPAVLYNKGRAHQALAQFPEALEALLRFEKEAPPALKAKVPKLAELIAEVRAKVSTLTVRCNVPGARVLVRGRAAPLAAAFQLQSGDADVEVSAEGYVPFKKSVTLPGGGELTVEATLVSKSTTGVLAVKANVPSAAVSIDGKPVGRVPASVVVEAGTHKVVLRAEGYEESTLSAVVAVGATREVNAELVKIPGITGRWWFWAGVSAVVVSGVVIGYAALSERKADSGDFSPGQVSGPLFKF